MAFVSVYLLLAALLPAQQTPTPPDSGVVIKAGAQEVSLDLVVRDSKGRIVKNVQRDQVEIYEDGVKQPIRSFRFVQGKDEVAEVSPKVGAASEQGVANAPANALPTPNVICLVFHGIDPTTKKNAMDAAQAFLKTNLQPNSWVGLFMLGSNLTPISEFTTDAPSITKDLNRILTSVALDFTRVSDAVLSATPNIATIETVTSGSGSSTNVSSTLTITGGEINPQAINGADVSNGVGANRIRGDENDARRQFTNIAGKRDLDSMNLLVDQLSKLPGRKIVVLFSTGIVSDGDPDHFDALIKKANKADVTFYAMDVNGLQQNSNGLAADLALSHAASLSASQAGSTSSAAQNMEKMRQDDYLVDGVRSSNTQATMRTLAENTGGFLIGNTNNLSKPFRHLADDLATHYEATYEPTVDKYDGRLRTISVKLARPDWVAESRTGYYAMPVLAGDKGLTPTEMLGMAALNVKRPPHTFDFGSTAFVFGPAKGGSEAAVEFELPAANLAAQEDPATKRYFYHLSILGLIKNANGDVVDKFSQDSPFVVPAANLEAVKKNKLNFSHTIDLPPGHYTVEIAATDHEANHASTAKFEFDNPAHKGLGLSSVALVQRLESVQQFDPNDPLEVPLAQTKTARKIVPEVDAHLEKEPHRYAYFVVYPDRNSQEKPRVRVQFVVSKQVLATQDADLPAPLASGAIPMLIGAASRPGDRELRVTALQGSESSTQSVMYTVAQ